MEPTSGHFLEEHLVPFSVLLFRVKKGTRADWEKLELKDLRLSIFQSYAA